MPLAIIVTVIASMGGMMMVTKTGEMGQDSALDPLQVRLASIHHAAVGAGVFQIRSHEPEELSAWFTEKAERPVRLPSLQALGMGPVGGRILEMDGHKTPMAVYRDRSDLAGRSVEQPPLVLVMGGSGFPLKMDGGEPLAGGGGKIADFRGVRLLWLDRNGAPWMAVSQGTPEFMTQVAAVLKVEGG